MLKYICLYILDILDTGDVGGICKTYAVAYFGTAG